ncbi:hypothetical protein [Streptacidiphilus fuscans]|uniref:Uncharacterized protein n=1 Tax=Streptacidiphilus fuscans TaxID=2789292 RepID=A0A931FKQ0_9ACTN|nr:hypothetical protein [Streptacidiphilus fuscans]MBF9073909.1 hypothetical protein [Streptacidiphilus fuscans]
MIIDRIDALNEGDRASLRLRITCRTSLWPTDFTEQLMQRWPDGDCQLAYLTPLTREDVQQAALEVLKADGGHFVGLVQKRGMVALATIPVTLRQLLLNYAEHEALPATLQDAYSQACLSLCREHRRPAGTQRQHAVASAEQLLTVAARAGAALQFAGLEALADSPPEPAPGAIDLSQLGPGQEPDESGTSVAFGMPELRQLTQSGLFTPVGEVQWSFVHSSYREFLAARYLQQRGLHDEVVRELLWIGDGPARHIQPAHRNVAAWASGDSPAVFEDLLRDDPLVLTLADLQRRPDADRARVVDAVLQRCEDDDTARLDTTVLHRLDHPGIANQLRPSLAPGTPHYRQYAAAQIARFCPAPTLAADLLALATDAQAPLETRVAAVGGVVPEPEAVLKDLEYLSKDPSAEIAAAALRRLWPDHLTLDHLLTRVREPDPTYLGTAFVLRREVPANLGPDQILDAVAWASDVLRNPQAEGSPRLAVAVLARAIRLAEHMSEPGETTTAVAEALRALADRDDLLYPDPVTTTWTPDEEGLTEALNDSSTARRALALHLLTHATEGQVNSLLAAVSHSLVPGSDMLYWMENWALLDGAALAVARLTVRFPAPTEPEQKEKADRARAAHQSLRESTAWWDTPPEPTPKTAARKEALDEERIEATYNEDDLRNALTAVTSAPADAVRAAWQQALFQLHRTAGGTPSAYGQALLRLAVDAPSRPRPGTALDAQLRRAAVHLLLTAPLLTAADLTPNGATHAQVPEFTAFALVELAALQTDEDRWAGWAVALGSAYTGDTPELANKLLALCSARAGDRLAPLLTQTLDAAHEHTITTLAASFAGQAAARATILTWAEEPTRSLDGWHAAIRPLAASAHPEGTATAAVLARVIEADPAAFEQDSAGYERWLLAACAIALNPAPLRLWPLIRNRLDVPATRTGFLTALAEEPLSLHRQPLFDLPETALVDLYGLIVEDLGRTVLTAPAHSGFLSRNEKLADIVRAIPQVLITRATHEAANGLLQLSQAYPEAWYLAGAARTAARAAAAAQAAAVPPHELFRLAESARLRRISDQHHLLAVVEEALDRFRRTLHGPNGLVIALWNRDKDKVSQSDWWPCWEEDFSDIVASFLQHDIGGDRVIINREVQVRRPGLPGLRTDIQIEAQARSGSADEPIKVVIECKGCWNDELKTALADQLVAEYLQTPRTAGVFLTAYFHCDRWTGRSRGCPKTKHSLHEVTAHQNAEADAARATGVAVSAVTLDCGLPSKGSEWRMEGQSTG